MRRASVKVEPAQQADALGDFLVAARHLAVAGGRHQCGVKRLVQRADHLAVAQPALGRHQPHGLQLVEAGLLGALAQFAHARGFERDAQIVEFVELAEIEFAHAPAAAKLDLQVALTLQPVKRFAHRRAADMQPCRDLVLGEAIAGQQPEIENLLLDAQIHRRGQRRRAALGGSRRPCAARAPVCRPARGRSVASTRGLLRDKGAPAAELGNLLGPDERPALADESLHPLAIVEFDLADAQRRRNAGHE